MEGTASKSTKATADKNGNDIVDTYATKSVATTSANGLMSSSDKTKLGSLITYTIATANQTLSKTTAGYIKFIYASGANRTVTYPNVNGTITTITIPNGLVEIFCSTPNGYAPARVSQTYVS